MTTTLLETCGIAAPPPSGGEAITLPLTFLDMIWLHSGHVRRLLFYQLDTDICSEPHFLESTLVPKLKQSLSLTLKHYPPLAGHLLFPTHNNNNSSHTNTTTPHPKPAIRYHAPGDSVSLAIALSTRDFDDLVGNHARDPDQFYDFVPLVPPPKEEDDECKDSTVLAAPLMAIQVTLFPGRGICIGFSNHHVLGDARSIVGFIRAWASITKTDDRDVLPPPPVMFDKSVVNDPLGIDSIFWNALKQVPFKPSSPFPLPTNRVRATYTLRRADLEKLRADFAVLAKKPDRDHMHLSSFVVTAAYVWTCFLKSGDAVGEKVQVRDNVLEFFFFSVDLRGRTDPAVPADYFGNCLSHGTVLNERKELVGEQGFVIAAEAMAEYIKNKVNNKDEVLKGAEEWVAYAQKYQGALRMFSVSGSPRFDLSDADFGWGRARKVEVVSIDGAEYAMSLCKSHESEGGLEFGLSLPKERMEAFAAIFAQGLRVT